MTTEMMYNYTTGDDSPSQKKEAGGASASAGSTTANSAKQSWMENLPRRNRPCTEHVIIPWTTQGNNQLCSIPTVLGVIGNQLKYLSWAGSCCLVPGFPHDQPLLMHLKLISPLVKLLSPDINH